MSIGFYITSDANGVEFHWVGKDCARDLLSFATCGDLAVVLLGRLRYQNELRAQLRQQALDDDFVSDASTVLAMYRQKGLAGLAQLEGCFSVVVWDARAGRLVGRRDVMGGFPLFFGWRNGRLAIGTMLPPLQASLNATADNSEYFAEYLTLPGCAEHEVPSRHTPYAGIERLAATDFLIADARRGAVDCYRHWNWLDKLDDPGTDQFEPLAERFGELLRDSVRENIYGATAAHLSGGMDSTAVSLLALADMQAGRALGPLHAISLTYPRLGVLSQELPVIERITRGRTGLVAHLIDADELTTFDQYANPPRHDEPWPWLSTAGMEVARVAVADRLGVDTVLTGQGADEMLDVGPYHIRDLLRNGRLGAAWHEARQAAQAENCGIWPILAPFGLQPLFPARFHDGLGPLTRGGYANWMNMGDATIPPWIRPEFARRFGMRERALEHVRSAFDTCRPTVLSLALSKIRSRVGDLGRWNLSAPRGILAVHPFLDPRLLRFCLGMHARVRPWPRGVPKPLLGAAMRDILPEEVRTRPKSGYFNEPYFRGLAKHIDVLESIVQHAESRVSEWLDKDAFIACLSQAALGIGNRRIQVDRLDLTLSLLRWLSSDITAHSARDDVATVYSTRFAEPARHASPPFSTNVPHESQVAS